jgi:hypothetical protein
MLTKIDSEVAAVARKLAIQKLKDQDVDYRDLADADFDEIVKNREDILALDVKRVGLTTALAIALTVLTGGI